MKNKTFRCHICETVIFTDKERQICNNCKNEYVLKDGKYYRRNVYSRMYKNWDIKD